MRPVYALPHFYVKIHVSGGTPPYQLLIIPVRFILLTNGEVSTLRCAQVFGVPRNVSIPLDAFKDGEGSFSTRLPLPQGQKFLLSMSDATGFATGGSSDVLVVGSSKDRSCDLKSPGKERRPSL